MRCVFFLCSIFVFLIPSYGTIFLNERAEWPHVLPPSFLVDFPYFNPRGGNKVKRRRPENRVGGVVLLSEIAQPKTKKKLPVYLHFILTAHHVWWALEGEPKINLIALDIPNDLVLFSRYSSTPFSEALLMRSDRQLSMGQQFVWSFGTPFLESRFRDNSSKRSPNAYALLRGKVIGVEQGKIIHSTDIVPGFSGFPLLMKHPTSEEWVTIGINTILYSDGINGAIGPTKIEAFLRQALSPERYSHLNFLGGRRETLTTLLDKLSIWNFNVTMNRVFFPSHK